MSYLTLPEARSYKGMGPRLQRSLVLTIDPASGGSSQPGYAVTSGGILLEYGIITLPKGSLIHHRLNKLRLAVDKLVAQYGAFDVLILEKIAVAFGGQKGRGGIVTQGVVHLHWSCGVVLSAYPWPVVIQVTPQTWHAWVRKQMDEKLYKKTDANDALVLTCVTFHELTGQLPEGATISMLQQDDT
jgi:hypothetical protein